MNNLNEEILRAKELMGLITEGLIFYIDLIDFIGGKIKDGEKGIFRDGKDLGLGEEEDASKKKASRYLDHYKFTKGKKEDLPEGVLLPYEIVNETVVFEAGPVIEVAEQEPEVKKITFKEAHKCFTDNGVKAEDYIEACFKKEVIDVTDSVSWSYIGGDECINKITEDGLDDVVSCLTGK